MSVIPYVVDQNLLFTTYSSLEISTRARVSRRNQFQTLTIKRRGIECPGAPSARNLVDTTASSHHCDIALVHRHDCKHPSTDPSLLYYRIEISHHGKGQNGFLCYLMCGDGWKGCYGIFSAFCEMPQSTSKQIFVV